MLSLQHYSRTHYKIQSSRQHKQTDDTDRNSSGIYDAAAVRYIRRKKHAVFNEFRYYEQHPGLDKSASSRNLLSLLPEISLISS